MSPSRPDLVRQVAVTATDLVPGLVLPTDESLTAIVKAGRSLLRSAACSIAVVTDDGEELLYRAADGEGADVIVGVRLPVSRGVAGYVAAAGEAMMISEVRHDPRFARDVAEETGYVPTAVLAVPIDVEGEVAGVLTVLDPDTTDSGDALRMATAVAACAAPVLGLDALTRQTGRILFAGLAAAHEADDPDLARGLRQVASHAPVPDAELAELGALLAELRRAGVGTRRTVADILRSVATLAQGNRRR